MVSQGHEIYGLVRLDRSIFGIEMMLSLAKSYEAMKIGEIRLVDSLNIAHQRRMLPDQPDAGRLASVIISTVTVGLVDRKAARGDLLT